MEPVSVPPLSTVAICGGTHGNEMSGIYVVREMQKENVAKTGPFSITTLISNPRAVDVCRRYVESDLNRCFTSSLLRWVRTRVPNLWSCLHWKRCVHEWEKSWLGFLFSSSPITDSTPYEVKRAQELNAQLGPKGSDRAVDLLIDLHNTTANMGLCFIFYSVDWVTLHIYKYIQVQASLSCKYWGNLPNTKYKISYVHTFDCYSLEILYAREG